MAEKTFTSAALTSTDVNTYLSHTGGALNTWTPAIVQLGSVSVTVNEATYFRAGRLITATATVTVTGSGTGANDVVMSLPVNSKSGYVTSSVIGSGWLYDASVPAEWSGVCRWTNASSVRIVSDNASGGFLGSVTFTGGLATGDVISYQVTYEAAT